MTAAPPKPRRHRAVAWLLLSLTVMLTLGSAVAIFFTEDFVRLTFMYRLCSDDPQKRQYAVGYLARHVDDEQVMNHARQLMTTAEDKCFQAIVAGLDAGGVWGPEFGSAYVRHLTMRLPEATESQRAGIAVALARIVYQRQRGHDDERMQDAIDMLLTDDFPKVRLNGLSLAAVLPEPTRSEHLTALRGDPAPAVADRAQLLLKLLSSPAAGPRTEPETDDREGVMRRLYELEVLDDASVAGSPDLERGTPLLIRLHLVRVSRDADPLDLLPVFQAEQPTLRELATVIALRRFEPDELKVLARELIGSFNEPHRWSGVILAALLPHDDELQSMVRTRFENTSEWVAKQHYRLALHMMGELDEPFDPVNLLLHREMPRSTVIMALLQLGELEGLDWLLNPLGQPGTGSAQGLRVLMDTGRYHVVLAHFLPDMPRFNPWAEPNEQMQQIDTIREWYLLHRHDLETRR